MAKPATTFRERSGRTSRNIFRAIATDIHFWIPLVVLIGGFFLLDKLS